MPRGLVIAAIAAAALIVALLLWNQSRSLDAPDDVAPEVAASHRQCRYRRAGNARDCVRPAQW